MDMNSGGTRPITLGAVAGSTGELTVAENATISNVYVLAVGDGGRGRVTVSGNGVIQSSSGSTIPLCTIGGTDDSGEVTVKDNGILYGPFSVGARAGSVGTLTLTNNARGLTGVAAATTLGDAAGAIGYLYVRDTAVLDCMSGEPRPMTVGNAAGGTGVVAMTGGAITNVSTLTVGNAGYGSVTIGGSGAVYAATLNVGNNVNSEVTVAGSGLLRVTTAANLGRAAGSAGRVNLQGGTWSGAGAATLGAVAGARGEVQVTGGSWAQTAALNIGTVAGGTSVVNVANCTSATNITGAVTVGGGTTGGDRYGSVTISNATFGGGTAVSVLTNGFVELTGIGSVLRVNTLTVNGGQVTNHVQGLSGGVDVTNSALTSLVVTNGARMHLVFQRPSLVGAYWGLKWAGNRATQLQGMTNSGALSWDAAQAGGVVEIFTNATHTMVGYVVDQAGTTFRFR
jgi:hypothetical protein